MRKKVYARPAAPEAEPADLRILRGLGRLLVAAGGHRTEDELTDDARGARVPIPVPVDDSEELESSPWFRGNA